MKLEPELRGMFMAEAAVVDRFSGVSKIVKDIHERKELSVREWVALLTLKVA
jgi:hypothetical protein